MKKEESLIDTTHTEPTEEEIHSFINSLKDKKSNNICFDCGKDSTSWVSVTLGLFLCLNCAGNHRKLGTSNSLVKSISINTWNQKELRRIFVGGNKAGYSFFDKDAKSFNEKYNNSKVYIKILDHKVELSEEEKPGWSFMTKDFPYDEFKKDVQIEKTAPPKFEEYLRKEINDSVMTCLGSVIYRNGKPGESADMFSDSESEDQSGCNYSEKDSESANLDNEIFNKKVSSEPVKLVKKKKGIKHVNSERSPFLVNDIGENQISDE